MFLGIFGIDFGENFGIGIVFGFCWHGILGYACSKCLQLNALLPNLEVLFPLLCRQNLIHLIKSKLHKFQKFIGKQ